MNFLAQEAKKRGLTYAIHLLRTSHKEKILKAPRGKKVTIHPEKQK
jgi:hypothetical protein